MNSDPNPSVQRKFATSIYQDLVLHSTAVDQMLSEEGLIRTPTIKGHMEAHAEKVRESLDDIREMYSISEARLPHTGASNGRPRTQRQSLEYLRNSLRQLTRRIGSQAVHSGSEPLRRAISELSRKLGNDLCRTSYLLQ